MQAFPGKKGLLLQICVVLGFVKQSAMLSKQIVMNKQPNQKQEDLSAHQILGNVIHYIDRFKTFSFPKNINYILVIRIVLKSQLTAATILMTIFSIDYNFSRHVYLKPHPWQRLAVLTGKSHST